MTARVIMVHGAFGGGWAFARLRGLFEDQGQTCLTPDLRGHEAGRPRGSVVGLSMNDYAADIAALIAAQDQPPIVIGHSMGGLVAAMACMQARAAGLILLAPSAPWGVAGASLEEAASALGLYGLGAYWAQAVDPDYGIARAYSLDRLAETERSAVYDRLVPESGRALWEVLNWWLDPFMTTRVSAAAIGAPVLAVAGGRDFVHPAATVRQTAALLGARFHLEPQMSHWLIGEPGWEDLGRTLLEWIRAGRQAAA